MPTDQERIDGERAIRDSEICNVCKYFVGVNRLVERMSDKYGHCRRYPPNANSMGGQAKFPFVTADQSCGEFAK